MKRAKLLRGISERIDVSPVAARSIGLADNEIAMARQRGSSDPKIAAIVAYGLQVRTAPATITDQ